MQSSIIRVGVSLIATLAVSVVTQRMGVPWPARVIAVLATALAVSAFWERRASR